jgi:hypothetical protein
MSWTAEITNDPTRDFELYVELLNDGDYKARLQRNPAGELEIVFYGGDKCLIPWGWLSGIASRFSEETGSG